MRSPMLCVSEVEPHASEISAAKQADGKLRRATMYSRYERPASALNR